MSFLDSRYYFLISKNFEGNSSTSCMDEEDFEAAECIFFNGVVCSGLAIGYQDVCKDYVVTEGAKEGWRLDWDLLSAENDRDVGGFPYSS